MDVIIIVILGARRGVDGAATAPASVCVIAGLGIRAAHIGAGVAEGRRRAHGDGRHVRRVREQLAVVVGGVGAGAVEGARGVVVRDGGRRAGRRARRRRVRAWPCVGARRCVGRAVQRPRERLQLRAAFEGRVVALPPPHRQPAEAPRERLHEVPGVEGIREGAPAEGAALVARGGVGAEPHVVDGEGEGHDVQQREEEHLDAQQHAGDAEDQVGEGDVRRRLQDAAVAAAVAGRQERN